MYAGEDTCVSLMHGKALVYSLEILRGDRTFRFCKIRFKKNLQSIQSDDPVPVDKTFFLAQGV